MQYMNLLLMKDALGLTYSEISSESGLSEDLLCRFHHQYEELDSIEVDSVRNQLNAFYAKYLNLPESTVYMLTGSVNSENRAVRNITYKYQRTVTWLLSAMSKKSTV